MITAAVQRDIHQDIDHFEYSGTSLGAFMMNRSDSAPNHPDLPARLRRVPHESHEKQPKATKLIVKISANLEAKLMLRGFRGISWLS
jgi:hypothetical protein